MHMSKKDTHDINTQKIGILKDPSQLLKGRKEEKIPVPLSLK